MKFIDNLNKEEYIEFFNNFKYSHFMQSYPWGLAMEETRGKKAVYVGLKDNKNKLVAASLLLKKEMPFGYCYYYASRGYLIDFNDTKLVKTFTEEMKKFLKRTKGIYVKINPEIMYQEINDDGSRIENGKNNFKIFNNLINLGYIHQGFVKLYENNEPRYTFRRYYEKYKSMEEIDNSISKTFMQTVRRSYAYNLKINFDSNVDNFWELNKSNAKKDDFIQYSDNFYKTLYKYGKEYNNLLVFDVSVNGKKLYQDTLDSYNKIKEDFANNLISKKNKADSQDKLTRLEKELDIFKEYKDQGDMVICSLINGIANDMMWTMYIGNNKLGEYLFAVNRIYYETIKYCYEHKYRFLDLYGTVGDVNTKYKNLGGLHAYKKKYGDTYIEFIGEFDLVGNKFMYKVLPKLLGVYRYIRKKISK